MRAHLSLVALVAAAAVASCSSGGEVGGPLAESGGRTCACVPLPGTAPVVVADEVLQNHGREAVTVDSVELVRARGLRLVEAFLLPIADRTLMGTTLVPEENRVWAQRRPAAGGRVEARETVNLALLLDRPGTGSFDDVEVRYRAAGRTYVMRLEHAWEVVATTTCPALRS